MPSGALVSCVTRVPSSSDTGRATRAWSFLNASCGGAIAVRRVRPSPFGSASTTTRRNPCGAALDAPPTMIAPGPTPSRLFGVRRKWRRPSPASGSSSARSSDESIFVDGKGTASISSFAAGPWRAPSEQPWLRTAPKPRRYDASASFRVGDELMGLRGRPGAWNGCHDSPGRMSPVRTSCAQRSSGPRGGAPMRLEGLCGAHFAAEGGRLPAPKCPSSSSPCRV